MNGDSASAIVTVIIGMAVANFVMRFTPIAVLSQRDLPPQVMRWLSFVPISVMGSLVASEVLRPGGTWVALADNAGIPAALLTALAFRITKSFLGATLAGVLAFVVLRTIM